MSKESQEPGHQETVFPHALSRAIHIGIPIASIIVLFAFAYILFLPSNKDAIPPTSTEIYIPVYLAVVVVLVFGSMYLFKRLIDTDVPSTAH